jgi:hypothetical protein
MLQQKNQSQITNKIKHNLIKINLHQDSNF